MEIILTKQCESLTGSLGQGFGYHIQRRTEHDGTIRFWGVRKSKGDVPPDGHWKFILSCANLAQNKLHVTDIRVNRGEMYDALWKAGQIAAAANLAAYQKDFPTVFRANDVINLKNKYNL